MLPSDPVDSLNHISNALGIPLDSSKVRKTLAFFRLAGSAIVVDESDGVRSAVVVTGGGTEQKLHRIWRGTFYTIPDVEGAIEIRCKNGLRKQVGYVTGYMHTKIRVTGSTPCQRVVEIF